MISELLKQVMKKCGLGQKGLAEVLEVPLQRVKNLTAGNVQKLTREESEALIRKLNVRADWLITGELPMFQGEETHPEFIDRHQAIGRMRTLINAMPLSDLDRLRTGVLMKGNPEQDGPTIFEMIREVAQEAPSPALPDLAIIELAVEYVRNREQLEKRKLTAAQFAKAVRLTYQITLEEQTAGVSPGGKKTESSNDARTGQRTKTT